MGMRVDQKASELILVHMHRYELLTAFIILSEFIKVPGFSLTRYIQLHGYQIHAHVICHSHAESWKSLLKTKTHQRKDLPRLSWKWKWKWSRVRLLVTPWTAAYQAPPPMGFSRQEYWSGVPLPSARLICEQFNLIPTPWKESYDQPR